jgi:phage-related protein
MMFQIISLALILAVLLIPAMMVIIVLSILEAARDRDKEEDDE